MRQKQRFGIFREIKMKSVDTSLQHYLFPNINYDGWKFICASVLCTLIAALLWWPLVYVFSALTILCFYAFRDPDRITPIRSGAIIAPADGIVISISKEKGLDSLGLQNKNFTKICLYSSIFDVNVCRMPISARISKIFYDKGKSFSGKTNKNALTNERLAIALRQNDGFDLILQQTAVICNHRIISKIKNGDELSAGQRLGFIRFGGYTELFLPDKTEPQVCLGQKLIAGETIVADLKSDAPRLEGEIR